MNCLQLTLLSLTRKEARVSNYYDLRKTEIIPLKPHLSVAENAQHYFSKYQKARTLLLKPKNNWKKQKRACLSHSLTNSLDNVTNLTNEEIRGNSTAGF